MLKRFFQYFGTYKKELWISFFCVIAECGFELVIPLLMADIIDVGVAQKDVPYIVVRSLLMVGCALVALFLGVLFARTAARAARGFGANLRRAAFEKVQSYSFSNLDHFGTSSLVTRLTSDVTVLQNALSAGLRPLVRGPAMMLMGIVMAILLNGQLALVFLIAAPLLGFCLLFIVRHLRPMYGKMQKALDRVNLIVQENLIAIRTVKAYVRGDYESKKFSEVNSDLQSVSARSFHYASLNAPILQIAIYATIVCILWFGGGMVQLGTMQVGELTGFLSYVLQILNSLMLISSVFLLLTRSMTSASRLSEVLDEQPDITDANARGCAVEHGNIDFDGVYFKYSADADEYVLEDINLHIKAGQTVGIIGSTGSAKTSLVQLIPRLYDCSAGSLRIDGRDCSEYPLQHLRDTVSMVLQKNVLFSGTVRENLQWGCADATDEELDWACAIACAKEFVDRLPDGYDTRLDQGGTNVSGGQKQRLCIARALLKHPKVLIFDDSTSAVDTATEAKIQEALAKELAGTTKIIIAQRLSSIEHADQIVILDDGKINAVGTHETLLADNAIYQGIHRAQRKGAML